MVTKHVLRGVVTCLLILVPLGWGCGSDDGTDSLPTLSFVQPADDQLSLAGEVNVRIQLPPGVTAEALVVTLEDILVDIGFRQENGDAVGVLANVAAGAHVLSAETSGDQGTSNAQVRFETIALDNPDECEVLNQAHCLLPFPSSRFLEPADTPTGFRVRLPASGMPVQNGAPLDAEPYRALDGFSPVAPIMMHFPGGVDVTTSNASRLSAATRTYDSRSLDVDSPTVLLDVDTGERILHFVELDARADTPERQVLFLRPGKSLTPGHHYIVAARNLVRLDGSLVTPEPAFAALRDSRPTDIAAIESRRNDFERIFARLEEAGIAREDLVLAFDFIVQSDATMTRDMLSMRDQAFAWLAGQEAAGVPTFTVTATQDFDCSAANTFFGREVRGTFQVPLFLTSDPVTAPAVPAPLNRGSDGLPSPAGVTNPPFTVAIPCAVLRDDGKALPGLVLGHSFSDSGQGIIEGSIAAHAVFPFSRFPEAILAATDWTGSTGIDALTYLPTVLGNLNLATVNAARTQQGVLNTLILIRLVQEAAFNMDPSFHAPSGHAVLAGPDEETLLYGQSLGGTLAAMVSALSPDIQRVYLSAPGSFTLFADRSAEYELLTPLIAIDDPLELALAIHLLSDIAAAADFSGYATHITMDPLPGTNAKNVLVSVALFDQEISNLNVEWLARTMAIPNLEGSVLHDLPQIPDRPGPLESAMMITDLGAADLSNPAHEPFIPPLANLAPAQCSLCDPHGVAPVLAPAAADQMIDFLSPGGVIRNHCDGLCDGAEPSERAYGWPTRCDPFDPWWVPFDFCG